MLKYYHANRMNIYFMFMVLSKILVSIGFHYMNLSEQFTSKSHSEISE